MKNNLVNFTHFMSTEENEKVNQRLKSLQQSVNSGLFTIQEATFLYCEWLVTNYNRSVAFLVFTNTNLEKYLNKSLDF